MLYQLSGVHACNNYSWRCCFRAISFMYRTHEVLFHTRAINIPELVLGPLVTHPENDSIGVQEVSNRRSFAKELRVRGHRKTMIELAAIRRQRTLQYPPGLHRNGALLDHQFRTPRLNRNQSGNAIDGAQVSVAVGERRCAHANEDCVTKSDRFSHIRCEAQPTGLNISSYKFF